MPRRCSVCAHPEVEQINAAILAGDSYRQIAQRYGNAISHYAVRRHAKNHLPATLVKAQQAEEVVAADNLLGQVQDLSRQAQQIKDKAEKAGDLRTALQGIRELVRIVELLAKLSGGLDESPKVQVVNVTSVVSEVLRQKREGEG